jgi:hypothetical protein
MVRLSTTADHPATPLNLLWTEITGRCQLGCVHCSAGSGPLGTHGGMTTAEWFPVIEQASELCARDVQLIGGEPTTTFSVSGARGGPASVRIRWMTLSMLSFPRSAAAGTSVIRPASPMSVPEGR